jgi:hypothetical protein
MVVFLPLRAMCARSMVALQNFPRRHLIAPIPCSSRLFVRSFLVKALARDSALAAHPVLSSAAVERHINGRCPLSSTHRRLVSRRWYTFPTPMGADD